LLGLQNAGICYQEIIQYRSFSQAVFEQVKKTQIQKYLAFLSVKKNGASKN